MTKREAVAFAALLNAYERMRDDGASDWRARDMTYQNARQVLQEDALRKARREEHPNTDDHRAACVQCIMEYDRRQG